MSGDIRLQDALMVIDNMSITLTGEAWINGCNILALGDSDISSQMLVTQTYTQAGVMKRVVKESN